MSNLERFKAYAAVYLVLENDGKILLSRRLNTGYQDGNYSLVAGHLDGGETTRQAIIREAREEAGVEIQPEDLEVVHVSHRYSPHREYFDVYLRASKYSGEVVNLEPDKCDELAWFRLDELPDNIIPEVKKTLDNIQNGKHFDEFGWQ
jgi:8-oxo-dGTP diphosphatase